jgi:hypothetical protein
MRLNHSQIFIKEAQNARETLIWVLNPRCTKGRAWRVPQCGIIVLKKRSLCDSFPWYTKNTVVIGRSWCGTNPDESVGFEKVAHGTKDGGPIALMDIPSRFRWLTALRSSVIQTSRPHPGLCDDLENKPDCLTSSVNILINRAKVFRPEIGIFFSSTINSKGCFDWNMNIAYWKRFFRYLYNRDVCTRQLVLPERDNRHYNFGQAQCLCMNFCLLQ